MITADEKSKFINMAAKGAVGNSMIEKQELLNCPFCNGDTIIRYGAAKTVAPCHSISCKDCGVTMWVDLDHPSSKDPEIELAEIKQRWNTRVSNEIIK